MASAGARAYNEGLRVKPPAGSRDRAPGHGIRGRSPPEAERLLAFGHPVEAANLPLFFFSVCCKPSRPKPQFFVTCLSNTEGMRPRTSFTISHSASVTRL